MFLLDTKELCLLSLFLWLVVMGAGEPEIISSLDRESSSKRPWGRGHDQHRGRTS